MSIFEIIGDPLSGSWKQRKNAFEGVLSVGGKLAGLREKEMGQGLKRTLGFAGGEDEQVRQEWNGGTKCAR